MADENKYTTYETEFGDVTFVHDTGGVIFEPEEGSMFDSIDDFCKATDVLGNVARKLREEFK